MCHHSSDITVKVLNDIPAPVYPNDSLDLRSAHMTTRFFRDDASSPNVFCDHASIGSLISNGQRALLIGLYPALGNVDSVPVDSDRLSRVDSHNVEVERTYLITT